MVRVMKRLVPSLLLASCGGGGSEAPETPSSPPVVVNPPAVDTSLQKPVLTVNQSLASWTESNAHKYRLVYHKEGFSPVPNGYGTRNGTEIFTEYLQLEISLEPGTWILFVEAYDELGNSYFSDTIEITL